MHQYLIPPPSQYVYKGKESFALILVNSLVMRTIFSFRCKPGRIGKLCECSMDEVNSEDMSGTCRPANSSEICSNNGECICGQCVCRKRENANEIYFGRFCECDNFNCDRSDGLICGGNELTLLKLWGFRSSSGGRGMLGCSPVLISKRESLTFGRRSSWIVILCCAIQYTVILLVKGERLFLKRIIHCSLYCMPSQNFNL